MYSGFIGVRQIKVQSQRSIGKLSFMISCVLLMAYKEVPILRPGRTYRDIGRWHFKPHGKDRNSNVNFVHRFKMEIQ